MRKSVAIGVYIKQFYDWSYFFMIMGSYSLELKILYLFTETDKNPYSYFITIKGEVQ